MSAWLGTIDASRRDRVAVARVNARLRDFSLGSVGDAKAVDGGLFEMREHYALRHRLYCLRNGDSTAWRGQGEPAAGHPTRPPTGEGTKVIVTE